MRPQTSAKERQIRHTEASLLLAVFLLLIFGTIQLLIAKAPPGDIQTPLNINTATASELAKIIGISAKTAVEIVSRRQKMGRFTDVDGLGRLRVDKKPLIPAILLANAQNRLIVRTWDAARIQLIGCAVLLLLFFAIAHILLRRRYPNTMPILLNADPYLLPIAAFLSIVGIFLLFALKDPLRDRMSFAVQASGVLIGGSIALFVPLLPAFGKLPLHRYGYLYALAAVLGTILLGVLGSGPGGVRLSVAGTQPVEFIKILMVFFLAAYLAERGSLLNDATRRIGIFPLPRQKDILPLLVLYILPLLLFTLVRDLGPVLLLFGAFLLMIYLATDSGIYVFAGIAMLILGATGGYLLHFGVFATRLDMFLSPWDNTHKGGDQLAHGLWALSSGGVSGSGLGLSGAHFIPRGGSDLVFTALGEEIGLVGTLAIIVAILVVVWRGLEIARRLSSDFERYLAVGLSGLLALQTMVILFGNIGLMPLTGITLPFVAYGRSSIVASYFIFGVLLWLSTKAKTDTPAPISATFDRTTRRLFLFFVATLGVLGTGRLFYIQLFAADYLMSRTVKTPDADNTRRAHINPRLLSLAAKIGRGKIIDRSGKILAETKDGHRVYPLGASAGHLTGYFDPGVGGPTGLEARFDGDLRGFRHWRELCVYWRGKDIPGVRLPQGKDIGVTIDAGLQTVAYDALKQQPNAKRGAVVLLDVATGGVLASVTLPAYDPNTLTPETMQRLGKNADKSYTLVNRAIAGYYPPGSTFKIVTSAALFANNKADFTTNCAHTAQNVVWKIDGKTFARRRIVDDEGERPHGNVNLSEAVAQSCNVYFGRAGIDLGAESLRQTTATFSFSRLPTLAHFQAELPDVAYGQGSILATPLEMATVAQTVANGGKLILPTFDKEHNEQPTKSASPLNPENAANLAAMMRRVTQSGTAAGRFDGLSYGVAGKTGTAQNDRYDHKPHSWFIGFAPANQGEKPVVAFAVLVENGGYGSQTAVPIARKILQAWRR